MSFDQCHLNDDINIQMNSMNGEKITPLSALQECLMLFRNGRKFSVNIACWMWKFTQTIKNNGAPLLK